MHVEKVDMEGFLHFKEKRSVTMHPGVTAYTGPSGSGKSTIFQAIRWCVFGTLRAADIESVINDSSDKARVSIEFTHDGASYRLTRTRGRSTDGRTGPTSLELEEGTSGGGWRTVGKRGVTAVKKRLDVIFGVDMPLMETTMFTGDSNFVEAPPEDRRGILLSMLPDTREWERYHKKLMAEHKSVKAEATECAETLEDLLSYRESTEVALESAREYADSLRPIDEVKAALEAASVAAGGDSDARAVKLADLVRERKERQEEHDRAYKSALEKFTRLEELYESLARSFDVMDDHNADQEDANRRLGEITDDIRAKKRSLKQAEERCRDAGVNLASMRTNLQSHVDRLNLLRASLDALPDAEGCPTCDAPLTSTSRPALETKLKLDIGGLVVDVAQLRSDCECAEEEEDLAGKELDALKEAIRRLEGDKAKEEQAVNRISRAIDRESVTRESLIESASEAIGSPLENNRSALEAMDAHLNLLDDQLQDGVPQEPKSDEELFLEGDGDSLKEAVCDLQDELVEVEGASTRVDELEQAMAEVLERIEEQSAIVEEVDREVSMIANLREACSPKGVPTAIMGQVLGGVEFHLNSLLASVGRNAMSVRFSTSRTAKSGKEKPSLDILVTMGGVVRPVEALSGGERALISVASMAALGLWINDNSGCVVEDLYFDETLGAMDTDLSARTLRALFSAVEERFSAVHVITHDPHALSRAAGCRVVKMGEDALID